MKRTVRRSIIRDGEYITGPDIDELNDRCTTRRLPWPVYVCFAIAVACVLFAMSLK